MKYQFKTSATMKEYNAKNWWIDSGIVRDIIVEADNINDALKQYQAIVSENFGIDISRNALKNKSPMYRDTPDGEAVQCGYVITGKTDFNNDYKGWVTHYIDLWVSVNVVVNPFAEV